MLSGNEFLWLIVMAMATEKMDLMPTCEAIHNGIAKYL